MYLTYKKLSLGGVDLKSVALFKTHKNLFDFLKKKKNLFKNTFSVKFNTELVMGFLFKKYLKWYLLSFQIAFISNIY